MKKPAVICVDDEKIVLDSIKQQLIRHFGEDLFIEIAESGEEALEIMEELHGEGTEIALIISDQIMPSMKGDELLIRVHENLPNTRKILLTGQADVEAVGNAVNQADLYRYISKPWDETDLILTGKEAILSYHRDKTLEIQNEELKELNNNLELKVKQRTHKIREQHDEIVRQNEEITTKNEELKQSIDELTRARIGRRAILITFFIGIGLFILSEVFLEPRIEQYFVNTMWLAMGAKLFIALILQPIDKLAERILLKHIRRRKSRDNRINLSDGAAIIAHGTKINLN